MNEYQIDILRKAAAGELPNQLAANYTLDQLAQFAELIDAGLLSGEGIPNEEGQVCSIIHPSITLPGRDALESVANPPALADSGPVKTEVEKGVWKLQNMPWVARVIICD